MISLNCGGLSTNFEEFKLLVQTYKPRLVLVTETHITEQLGDEHLGIDGYNHVSCFSDSRHTGGVMIYSQSNIEYNVLCKSQIGRNWFLSIDVTRGMKIGRYATLYHSPNEPHATFLKILEENWLEQFVDLSKFIVVVGDFNIDWSRETSDASNLKQICDSLGLKQNVQDYTRITRLTKTMIDLVFSNCDIGVLTVSEMKISDHETLCWYNVNECTVASKSMKKITCWKNYSKSALVNLLRQNRNLTFNFENIHENAINLISNLKKCVQTLITEKLVSVDKCCKWFSVELLQMKQRRDQAYLKHVTEGGANSWAIYKAFRNEYSSTLRRKRKEYIQKSIEENKNNSKELWKILKKMIKPESAPANTICFDNVNEKNRVEIPRKFNEYFVKSVEEISNSIEEVNAPPELECQFSATNMSFFETITLEKLKSVIWSLESKSGSDNISASVLRDAFEVIGQDLLNVINQSLISGVVPDSWKESVVIPIEKVQGTMNASEFRPINMLPLYEKVLELTVKEQLLNYLNVNKLLAAEQSG